MCLLISLHPEKLKKQIVKFFVKKKGNGVENFVQELVSGWKNGK